MCLRVGRIFGTNNIIVMEYSICPGHHTKAKSSSIVPGKTAITDVRTYCRALFCGPTSLLVTQCIRVWLTLKDLRAPGPIMHDYVKSQRPCKGFVQSSKRSCGYTPPVDVAHINRRLTLIEYERRARRPIYPSRWASDARKELVQVRINCCRDS